MIELNQKKMCSHCFALLHSDAAKCPACGMSGSGTSVAGALVPGTILHGRYVLGRTLGKGGFSITYLAYDSRKDCVLAVKEFFPSTLVTRAPDGVQVQVLSNQSKTLFERSIRRFYEEAKMLSALHHPNIVNIFNLYTENGTVYYTMEYLDGCDLRYVIDKSGGRMRESEVVHVLSSVSDALQVVHKSGLLHRDIAPDNIFVTRQGQVKLIDFGAARNFVSNESRSFSVVLKHGFAPAEQYQRKGRQGPWTDIYALGSSAYYCLTGKMPLMAADRMNDPTLNINCSAPLAWVLRKMMAVRAEERYQTIDELRVDIETVKQLTGVKNQPEADSHSVIAEKRQPTDNGSQPVNGFASGEDKKPPEEKQNKLQLLLKQTSSKRLPIVFWIMAGTIIFLFLVILILLLNM